LFNKPIMNTLTIVITIFIILESLNIIVLYFFPESDKGNGVKIFNAFEKSKSDPEIHAFINYLINWVAGTKLIFILLLIAILLVGNNQIKLYGLVALLFSVSTYFWRLHPLIKLMDESGWIFPKGYSRTLGYTIAVFLIVFTISLIVYLILNPE